ncbi:MAG TPA: sulfatase [Thermoanaerobaculia bacterium]|nr:sulfatase [Thermoanaerobaculia bacterium]
MKRSRWLLGAALFFACRAEPVPPALPWVRVDLTQVPFAAEMAPAGPAAVARTSYLGSAEVRDMRMVPVTQLAHFPKRTAGQVQALEMKAGSRVRWPVRVGRDGYLSFTPLGSEGSCACTYRVGVREGPGKIRELYRVESAPMVFISPAAEEVDLSGLAGRNVEILLQLDGPPGSSALWGSPAVYHREAIPERQGGDRPNILLVGFDTLRADALGAWGRSPSLTPNLDRLAEQSDVWLDAYTVFNSTNPSFVSMMTGLYGKSHGVYDLKTPLPRSHTTLAEHLSGAGYDTFAVISASHLGDHNSGLGQGFGKVVRATEHHAAELAVDTTLDWIAGRQASRPFFAWLHLFDPHTPHTPPHPYALGFRPASALGLDPVRAWIPFRQPGPRTFVEQVLGGQRDLYDGEVAYLDRQIGRLTAFLESRGLLGNTILVLVADHGESLGEHGVLFRHVGLHDVVTHVPLMIRWPNKESRRIEGLVQTIDLFPTILRAAGLPVPSQDGRDLQEPARRAVFAEHSDRFGAAVRTRDHKYIRSQGLPKLFPDGPYLYDLKADPGETQNLAGRGLAVEGELSDLLRQWQTDRRSHPKALPREQTDEEKARLKALGYG